MKLYQLSDGNYVATQEEAKAWKREEKGRNFRQADVPTSSGREALADFLNSLVAEALETPPPAEEAPERVTNVVPLVTPAQDSVAHTADGIVGFILDEAPVHIVENILATLGTRVGELAKERRA